MTTRGPSTGHIRYRLLGCEIASELELHAPPGGAGALDIDLAVDDPAAVGEQVPDGVVVAEHIPRGRRLFTAVRQSSRWLLRVHGLADFAIDGDLRRIRCTPAPGIQRELLSILFSGTVMAFLLGERGRFVLHGSAVRLEGSTLAFLGASGSGKSTLAAQFCAAGAELVVDDVLALDLTCGVDVVGRAGELRLREKATGLVDQFAEKPMVRDTADGRLAIRPAMSVDDRAALDAIILPRPSHDAGDLRVERVRGTAAVLELSRFPRIVRIGDAVRRDFEAAAAVAGAVPVYRAVVPWGPPFAPEVPRTLYGAIHDGLREKAVTT